MTLDTELIVNLEMDTMAVLILLGLAMIPKSSDEKQNTGTRLFTAMGILIVIGVAAEIFSSLFPYEDYSWGLTVVLISAISVDLSVIALLIIFFIYTDYALYESRDHLKRHMVPYLMPAILFALICILLPWLVKIFDHYGLLTIDIVDIAVLTDYLTLVYLFLTALHFVQYHRKYGEKRFLHPLSIYVPILCGALFTFFTTFTGIFLGFSLGLLFLVFSQIDSYRFQDREYRFYNEHYLKYILSLVGSGKEDRKSIILFTAKGDAAALSRILKQELPSGSEVISLGEGDFLYLSKIESGMELEALSALILDAVEEYDEGHEEGRIGLETSFRIYEDFMEIKEILSVEG